MKIAIIGYGSIGKRHLKNLSNIFKGEILLCTKQSLNGKKLSRVKIINSIEKCIQEEPDAVLIANETNLHITTAIKFAKSKTHIFIEKPLSNSNKNIPLLLNETKKHNLTTLIGCNLRFHPCLIKLKQLIIEKKIGKILSVNACNSSYLPLWHKNEDYSKSYAANDKISGGIVMTSIHEIDYLYWLFGNVENVFSYIHKLSDLKIQGNDHASIMMKFSKGMIGEIHLDFYQQYNVRYCKVIGSKGILYLDFLKNFLRHYDYDSKKWNFVLKINKFDYNSMYVQELTHFIDKISKKQKTINDITQAINVQNIGMAILKSSKLNKSIEIE